MKSKPSPATYEDEAGEISLAKQPRLRVALKDVPRPEFAAAVRERLGKQRVSIMLDAEVIAFFRAKAGDRGYQTLINQALHEVMAGERLEATLRRVIREEIHLA